MDRTVAQPQVNLSLLRSNSLRLYCITIVRGIDYSHYTSRLFRVYKLMEAGWRGGADLGWVVTVYIHKKEQIRNVLYTLLIIFG
jgi:hypothetical protein